MNSSDTYLGLIDQALQKGRVPQSMLLVGELHFDFESLLKPVALRLVCKNKNPLPCQHCNDCIMVLHGDHPDLQWVRAEKKGGSIKIDQIRELQNDAYLTPQRATYRIIVLESVDRMNKAASNALLKILEEPPEHTLFFLIAEQIGTLLPTLLSRCHLYRFVTQGEEAASSFLHLGALYPKDSDRARLVQDAAEGLQLVADLLDKKIHACELAAKWSKYDFGDLLWFLYLLYAEALKSSLLPKHWAADKGIALDLLTNRLTPRQMSDQIYKISQVLQKISHNMNINPVLALEQLLFDLVE